MPVMDARVVQRLEQRAIPAQLLLAELLPLPVAGLADRLEAELDGNPALDLPAPLSCDGCGLPRWRGRCAWCRTGWAGGTDRLSAPPSEDAVVAVPARDRHIAAYLLADVDPYGLLAEPLSTVAARIGCTEARLRRVISSMRAAGRPGICAATLAERIALQVAEAARTTRVPAEVWQLIRYGLSALADGRLPSGLTPADVGSALAWLRRHVAADLVEPSDGPVPPLADVLIRRSGSAFVVETVPGPWSAVRVAPAYLSCRDLAGVPTAIARADRFIDALRRREDVLARVCAVVADRQAARLESGPRALRTLSRREVAVELGLHESTVSRAVAGKYVLLPSGQVAALSTFFGAAADARQCLADLLSREAVPRSDAELARIMARHGHLVARRTIAKYRAELGIPRHRHRKGADECA